jgi:hypothetical protein
MTRFVFGISETKKPLKNPPSVLFINPFKKKF